MQNTGKSIETAWNVDLQNMKRQVPGRAGADGPEGGNRKAGNRSPRHPAHAGGTQTQHAGIHKQAEESLLKRRHTAIRFIASAGYIYFFSWLYIYQPAVNKNKQNISTGQPVNMGCF